MKRYFIYIFVFLIFISCSKSEEQKAKDKKEALRIVQEADKLFFENKFLEAIDLFLKAEDLDHDDPVLNYKIGFCYYKGSYNFKKAKKYYLKALKKLKTGSDQKYLAAVYFNLGLVFGLTEEPGKKEEYFNLALSLYKELLVKGGMGRKEYFRLGYYYYYKKEYTNARKYFKIAIKAFKKENPKHYYYTAAYFNIGVTYWEEDDLNSALFYWKITVDLEPDNKEYKRWYNQAMQIKKAE